MANLIILLRGHTRTHLARLVSERKEKTPALHANITAVRQGLLILACSPHFHLKQMLLFFFCHCITPVVWRRCLLVDLLCKEDYMGANFTLQNLLNVWSFIYSLNGQYTVSILSSILDTVVDSMKEQHFVPYQKTMNHMLMVQGPQTTPNWATIALWSIVYFDISDKL